MDTSPFPPSTVALLRLLGGGLDYGAVAERLELPASDVELEARGAISALAGESALELTEGERSRLADWLLGVVDDELLASGSPAARRFLSTARSELERIGGPTLRSLPESGSEPPSKEAKSPRKSFVTPSDAARRTRPGRSSTPKEPLPPVGTAEPEPKAAGETLREDGSPRATDRSPQTLGSRSTGPEPAPTNHAAPAGSQQPKTASLDATPTPDGTPAPSRRGGLFVLGGAGAVILVGVLAVFGAFDGGSGSDPAPSTTTQPSQQRQSGDLPNPAGGGSANGWKLGRAFVMKPPSGGSQQGAAAVSSKDGKMALLVAGNSLPARAVVGTWLRSKSGDTLISLNQVDAKGAFVLAVPMPAAAAGADSLIIARESFTPGGARPTSPGEVLLSTPFRL